MLGEDERHEDLERPLGAEGGTGDVALWVGEGRDEDKPVGWKDLAVDEFAPHFLAVGHAKAVKELAAGAEVHVAEADGAAFGPPPAAKVIGVGPEAEDEFARCVEHAGDGEAVAFQVAGGRIGGRVGRGHGGSLGWMSDEWGSV